MNDMAKKKQARPRKPATVKPRAAGKPAADADASKITPVQKRTLVAFSRCGSIFRTVKEAGSCRATHYKALKNSPRYRAAFEQAQEAFADLLREAANHRAIRGVPRLKFYKGQVVMAPVLNKEGRPILNDKGEPVLQPYVEFEFSDALLIKLLQARCPEFLDTTRLEHTGPGGGPIQADADHDRDFADLIQRFSA